MYKGLHLNGHIVDVITKFRHIPYNALLHVLMYDKILPMRIKDAAPILQPQLEELVEQKQLVKFTNVAKVVNYRLRQEGDN